MFLVLFVALCLYESRSRTLRLFYFSCGKILRTDLEFDVSRVMCLSFV